MTLVQAAITKVEHGIHYDLPKYATSGSAGVDLVAAIPGPLTLEAGARALIPSGIAIALPQGYEAQIRSRSGLALKNGIIVFNAPGTIDSDYRGEIQIILINCSQEAFLIEPGMRIAQMVIAPYTQIDWNQVTDLDSYNTKRLAGGFGSTGV